MAVCLLIRDLLFCGSQIVAGPTRAKEDILNLVEIGE